jgi:Uma2 family endonuclease
MSALPQKNMTEADYLEFERGSDTRHEYLSGQIYAMSGASRNHNIISSNINGLLYNHLDESPCEHYQSDMRVHIPATGLYTYPDLSVACAEIQLLDDKFDTLLNPVIIFEVLSATTEKYDRGEKFQSYRTLPSLQEYVLISQNQARIEHYLRQKDNKWSLTDVLGLNATFELPSIKLVLALDDVYRKVSFIFP